MKGRIEVTRRRGRRCKQLLNDIKEKWGYCKFKGKALRLHFMEKSISKSLWTCRKTDYRMNNQDCVLWNILKKIDGFFCFEFLLEHFTITDFMGLKICPYAYAPRYEYHIAEVGDSVVKFGIRWGIVILTLRHPSPTVKNLIFVLHRRVCGFKSCTKLCVNRKIFVVSRNWTAFRVVQPVA